MLTNEARIKHAERKTVKLKQAIRVPLAELSSISQADAVRLAPNPAVIARKMWIALNLPVSSFDLYRAHINVPAIDTRRAKGDNKAPSSPRRSQRPSFNPPIPPTDNRSIRLGCLAEP